MSKKTITIPAKLGINNFSDILGKIQFTSEMKEFLSALQAEIRVGFNPDSEAPLIEVVDRSGKKVCSIDEFKALTGCRSFTTRILREIEKEKTNSKKVELAAYYIRSAQATVAWTIPERVLEKNKDKFHTMGALITVVEENLETIEENGVESEFKTLLVETANDILRIQHRYQMMTMTSEVVDPDFIKETLFDAGIPKSLYNRLTTKTFASNMKSGDCKLLLFSKGNYLNAVAFSSKELLNEQLLTRNRVLLTQSGAIIALSRGDYSYLYPRIPTELRESVEEFIMNFQWPLTGPFTSEEILALRESGKNPPMLARRIPVRGPGGRPEDELSRITREISNVLGTVHSTWNGIMNYVVPVAAPKTMFWNSIFPDAENWLITPTNSIYDCMRADENGVELLAALRDVAIPGIAEKIGHIMAMVQDTPGGVDDHEIMISLVKPIQDRNAFVEFEGYNPTFRTVFTVTDVSRAVEVAPILPAEFDAARTKLGYRQGQKAMKKIMGRGKTRLSSEVLNELNPIKGHEIFEPVKNWLQSSFKTNKCFVVQGVAARRIVGEFLANEDVFLPDREVMDELLEIEDYYDEED
jgi:hypothetical protein